MEQAGTIRSGSSASRWVITAAVLGSGIAFLDATVVNVALPAIGRDLGTGLSGLQWVLDGYLLTLSALLLLGGSLGDLYGRRRMFVVGLVAFSAASVLCGVAPNVGFLVAARALQGVGGALLVPGSLSLLSASFRPEDRGPAVGAWSGLAGVVTALGPFAGGWLVDAVSWRWVFLINLPLAAVAAVITVRHVPESRDPAAGRRPDLVGAALVTVGLAGLVYALIEGSAHGSLTPELAAAGTVGLAAVVAFPFVEARVPHPLVPLSIFRSRQFVGANLTTLTVYAAFGGALFLVALELQGGLGYSALEAGSALLPITLLLVTLSTHMGKVAQRTGPRLPMTAGPVLVGAGLFLAGFIGPGDGYATGVLPAVLILGLGMAVTVAPLTSAVMASVDDHRVGVASGLNNAVARVGGLLAVAVLPALSGLGGVAPTDAEFGAGVARSLRISAVLAAAGGACAWALVRRAAPVRSVPQVTVAAGCQDPCLLEPLPARQSRPEVA
ncbi:MAG: DHA2 family efflux MFS transporter permease subunit [Acidimicrobiales bacterium]